MNKKAKAPVDGPTEPVVPQVEVEEVKENPAKEVLKPETSDMSWWQSPNLVAEQEKYEAAVNSRMEADEARAKRMRNAAIIGDIARLVAQAYSLGKGGTKIKEFTPATSTANEKIQALRDKHSAQLAEFVKQRAAAREAERVDNNAKGKMKAELDAAARKGKQSVVEHLYKVQRDLVGDAQKAAEIGLKGKELEEKKRYNDAMLEIRKSEADSRNAYRAATAEWRKNSPRSGKDKDGNISLYLKGEDTPVITMGRQFWEDNQAGIQAIADRARFNEWLNSLDDFGKTMYSLGKIEPPEGEADWTQYPDAVKEVVELHKAWQAQHSANSGSKNVLPVAPLPQDTTKPQATGSPMNRKNNQGNGAY